MLGRGSRLKGSRRRRGWWGALAGMLALAGLAAWWLWPAGEPYRPPAPAKPPITYEEPLPTPPAPPPGASLQAVDEALFSALGRAGLPPSHIKTSQQRQPGGSSATLMVVRLPPTQDLEALHRRLTRSLKAVGVKSSWRRRRGTAELLVYLDGKLTHRLRLWQPERPPGKALPTTPPPPAPPLPPPGRLPRVALVVDDLGYQWKAAQRLAGLGLKLTFSILPGGPYSHKTARLARRHGLEVLLHLPMEPRSYPRLDPGPGALLTTMSLQEIRQRTLEDLAAVPGVKGVNNHMGSRFTERRALLRPVFEVLRERGLFFLDSATSAHSQALDEARREGLAAARRDLFLDHDYSLEAVRENLRRLPALAARQGDLIVIAHPHPSTITALEEAAPQLRKQIRLVPLSSLVALRQARATGRRNARRKRP